MAWEKIEAGSSRLKYLKAAADLNKFDSYLLWADLTYFHKLPTVNTSGKSLSPLPVVFEADLSAPANLAKVGKLVNLSTFNDGGGRQTHTGFIQPENLNRFSALVDRFRIGSVTAPVTKRLYVNRIDRAKINQTHEWDDSEVVVGIIDHGIAFAHKGFCHLNNGANGVTGTRIEHFWDQQWGYPVSPPDKFHAEQCAHFGGDVTAFKNSYRWRPVQGFGYGRELTDADINALMRKQPDEMRIYKEQRYPPAQGAISHGTHVLGIAADGQKSNGDAQTKIIAVQMPALPYKNTSGESLCVHVLDAVRYILHHARGRKVVINLSDGAYAGPHDGTSLLEAALDAEITQSKDRLAFVVAAGNQFDERVHWQAAIEKNTVHNIQWRVLPDDKTDSHVEIWFDANTTAEALKTVAVEVSLPGSAAKIALRLGETAIFDSGNQVVTCVMFRRNAVNSQGRALVHIALAPTVHHQAPHGIFNIALAHTFNGSISFNAYAERDNPALGDKGPRRQSHFIHSQYPKTGVAQQPCVDDSDNPSPIKRMGALNNIATAAKVLVVGGYVEKTRQIAHYSACGPGRGKASLNAGVDVLAPSDATPLLKGVRSFASRSGTTFRMNGTSVAAPVVTRKVATLLRSATPASQVLDALRAQASTSAPTLRPDERVGVGRIHR